MCPNETHAQYWSTSPICILQQQRPGRNFDPDREEAPLDQVDVAVRNQLYHPEQNLNYQGSLHTGWNYQCCCKNPRSLRLRRPL